MSFQFRFKGW